MNTKLCICMMRDVWQVYVEQKVPTSYVGIMYTDKMYDLSEGYIMAKKNSVERQVKKLPTSIGWFIITAKVMNLRLL